jgi:type I restriction enzyme M protein
MSSASALVSKVWSLAHVLRDDGVSYGDYLEQITLLVFLKMAQEDYEFAADMGIEARTNVPEEHSWAALRSLDGAALEGFYRSVLNTLGTQKGLLGTIFRKAQNKIQDPAKLKRVITMIDAESWRALDVDVKGDIYEGLLERNAKDIKSGAGQYFTPRPLIDAMVQVCRPKLGWKIADPACGTAGFLIAAHQFILHGQANLNAEQRRVLREKMFFGVDIVDGVVRLAAMNMYLHGIGGEAESLVRADDSLRSKPSELVDLVLTNPPFGKKSSIRIINEEGDEEREALTYSRDDFWATTSNKQLNFVQHIVNMLKIGGLAAVVLPDNVLFEGGTGETIRKNLLKTCDVHTLLRLPTGIFYAQGVKANVLFFERRAGSDVAQTQQLWVYDLRTNQHFTLKENPLQNKHLEDFVACYNPDNRFERFETERFKAFSYADLLARDKANLDIFWLRDESLEESDNLPAPSILAQEIMDDLESALAAFSNVAESLN